MSRKIDDALAAPYTTPLIFRTEVTPQLYLASAGLTLIGVVFTGYYLTTDAGFTGILAATLGVFILYVAWVNFWSTRGGGYPHLILLGHRLTVQSSDAIRKDIDLSRLGEAKIVSIRRRKSGTQIHLGFLPGPGGTAKNSRFSFPELTPFAETILLNGYIGSDLSGAKDIERVINARRAEPRQPIALPPDNRDRRSAARLRLFVTASVFAILWVALVWWRALR
jgi:hypothetical protein